MNESTNDTRTEPVSLKLFLVNTVLWLPLCFFFWFQWAGLFVAPVNMVVESVLAIILGGQLRGLSQDGYVFLIEIYYKAPDGTRLAINPMIYGYGLPVLAGLVISTPNSIRRRVVHQKQFQRNRFWPYALSTIMERPPRIIRPIRMARQEV